MYKVGDKVEYCGEVVEITQIFDSGNCMVSNGTLEAHAKHLSYLDKHKSAHEKLIEMGLKLKITKNYADGVFSHEWWNENDDRVIVFYIDEKVTTVYEGNNEIMAIIPQYLEESGMRVTLHKDLNMYDYNNVIQVSVMVSEECKELDMPQETIIHIITKKW